MTLMRQNRLVDRQFNPIPISPIDSGNITRTTRLRATPFTPGGLRPLHNHDVTIPLDVSGQGNAGLRGYGRTPANETTGASDGTNAAPGNGTTAALEANGKALKGKGGKKGETLFGPDLGLDENESEGWIKGQDKKERVPLSVVKDWVENAKKEEVSRAVRDVK